MRFLFAALIIFLCGCNDYTSNNRQYIHYFNSCDSQCKDAGYAKWNGTVRFEPDIFYCVCDEKPKVKK